MTTADYDNGYDDCLDDVVAELERRGIPNARDIVASLDSVPKEPANDAATWYREAVAKVGFLSLNAAGRWFGLGSRAARDAGRQGPPPSVEKLLRFMLATGQGPAAIDAAIGNRKATGGSSEWLLYVPSKDRFVMTYRDNASFGNVDNARRFANEGEAKSIAKRIWRDHQIKAEAMAIDDAIRRGR